MASDEETNASPSLRLHVPPFSSTCLPWGRTLIASQIVLSFVLLAGLVCFCDTGQLRSS
jgi:hypothetical protein